MQPTQTQAIISVQELSEIIGIAPQTIYNRIGDKTKAHTLPPRTYIPGCARVLFRMSDVQTWLESLTRGYLPAKGQTSTADSPRRGRGRPRKSEAVARKLFLDGAQ